MAVADYVDYYSGVIDSGRYAIDDINTAQRAIDKLVDDLISEIDFSRTQISLYSAVPDEYEGFVYLRSDDLREEEIAESVDNAFYIKAILFKFPELQPEYNLSSLDTIIDAMNDADNIAAGIKGKNTQEHYMWKSQIMNCFAKAYKAAKQIK